MKEVRNLAHGLLAREAVHLLRSSIPIKDAIFPVTHTNGIAAQVEQAGAITAYTNWPMKSLADIVDNWGGRTLLTLIVRNG